MGDLQFWNINTIWRNNRKHKIYTLGKIKVTGIKIDRKKSKWSTKYSCTDDFQISMKIADSIETLEMWGEKEFLDMEGKEVNIEDYDLITEFWDYDKELNLITFNYEFLIYEKYIFNS